MPIITKEKLKSAMGDFASFLYASLKKLIQNTVLFSKFSISGKVIRYNSDMAFHMRDVGYEYQREGVIKNYINSAKSGLVGLAKLPKRITEDRRLAEFGAVTIVLETFVFFENSYLYYSASVESLSTEEDNNTDESSMERQLVNIEACLYENSYREAAFSDFVIQVEEKQLRDHKVLDKETIKDMFFEYRKTSFLWSILQQFKAVLLALVFVIARLLNIPTYVTMVFTLWAVFLTLIFSKGKDNQSYDVAEKARAGDDPREILRLIEASVRLKRTFWVCKSTYSEMKDDEKSLRQLRQIFLFRETIENQDVPFDEKVAMLKVAFEQLEKSKQTHPMIKAFLANPTEAGLDVILKIDMNKVTTAAAIHMRDKYRTLALVGREIKAFCMYVLERFFLPNIAFCIVFSLLTLVMPVGIYMAIHLILILLVLDVYLIKPLEGYIENSVYSAIYHGFKSKVLTPIIKFFIGDKTIHKLDSESKDKFQEGCLSAMKIANTADVFSHDIDDDFVNELTAGTRF